MTAINYLEDGEVANDVVLNRPLREALTAMGLDPDDVDTVLTSATAAATYSPLGHTHDDRYFTEAEATAAFAPIAHTHDDRYFTESEVTAGFSAVGHTHDDRYYTETEVDALFDNFEAGEKELFRGRGTIFIRTGVTAFFVTDATGTLITGTETVPDVSSTSMITAQRGVRLATTAATNQAHRCTVTGTGARPMRHTSNGGFRFQADFGHEAGYVSGQCYGIGVHGSVNPQIAAGSFLTGITDCVYFGFDTGDAPGNWFLWNNDNAGNATKTDTGVARDLTSAYRVVIECDKTGTITASLFNYETGAVLFSQQLSSNMPTSGTLLLWGFWGSTASVATACQSRTMQMSMVIGTLH